MLLLRCQDCHRHFYYRKVTTCPSCGCLMECLEGSSSEPPDTPGSRDEVSFIYSQSDVDRIGLENLQSHDEGLREYGTVIQKVLEESGFLKWFEE